MVAVANFWAGNCSLSEYVPVAVSMLEPSWLTLLSLALNRRDTDKHQRGLQAFEVARLTGCTPAGKRKPIKSTQRQNVLCERPVILGWTSVGQTAVAASRTRSNHVLSEGFLWSSDLNVWLNVRIKAFVFTLQSRTEVHLYPSAEPSQQNAKHCTLPNFVFSEEP